MSPHGHVKPGLLALHLSPAGETYTICFNLHIATKASKGHNRDFNEQKAICISLFRFLGRRDFSDF
jgi:hypothetical protein